MTIPTFSGNKDKDGIDPKEWLKIVKGNFEKSYFLKFEDEAYK